MVHLSKYLPNLSRDWVGLELGSGWAPGRVWVGIGLGLGWDWVGIGVGIGSGLGRDWVRIGSGSGRDRVGHRLGSGRTQALYFGLRLFMGTYIHTLENRI
jgi:hypothetical protein